MKDTNVEHLAVLIDAENISHHRIKAIMEDIAGIGDVLAKRIYGDFSTPNYQPWIDYMKDLAIVPVFQPSYTSGKNSSDIALVIDAMDLLYTGRYDVDTPSLKKGGFLDDLVYASEHKIVADYIKAYTL